jgi:lipoprotein-releasing system permease protein
MNLPFFIAKKYFLSKKKRSFINFISLISMLGLCLGTMALVIVLSVFNGLEDLNRQIFKAFDPDLKITSIKGKSFLADSGLKSKIQAINGVKYVTEVYQDKALAKSQDAQMIVVIKGVDDTFEQNTELNNSVVEGKLKIQEAEKPLAFVGGGVYNILDLRLNDYLYPLTLTYPKSLEINTLNPESNLSQIGLEVAGVFILEQQYDNFVYLPLAEVEALTGNIGKRTALELTLEKNADSEKIKSQILDFMPSGMQIKNRDEQNASLLRAIKIEKLFIFMALFFIIGISTFNLFYALSMLVLDKKDDIQTLSSFGADQAIIKKIFILESLIIAFVGVVIGLILGIGICLLQIQFGIIKLGMQYALVDAYPVKILLSDILWSILGVFLLAILAAIIPANKAKTFLLNI